MAAKTGETIPPQPSDPAISADLLSFDTSKEAQLTQSQADDAASQATTSSTSSIIQVTAMDFAYSELQRTIQDAETYRLSGNMHPQHLKSHIEAIKEDTGILATLETTDDVLCMQAAQLLCTARRLRRALERDVIDAEIACPSQDTTPTPAVSSTLKLTPLSLPTFAGDTSQFRLYRSFFEENIINNNTISDTNKWLRLKESLQGRPAELISEIPQSADTLSIAWKLLIDIYGGEDRPVVELYNKLQQLPPSSLQTDQLRLTHSKLEGLLMSLQHLGHDPEANHFIRWTYLGKFPVEVMYQAQQTKDTPLKDIRIAIGQIIAARECTDQQRGQVQAKPTEHFRRSGQSANGLTDTPRKSPAQPRKPTTFPKALKCVFCEGEHWNDSCQVYTTLDARKQKLTGRCFKCLRLTHPGAACLTEKRCFHCDSQEHNRALCPVKFGAPPSSQKPQLALSSCNTTPIEGNFLTFLAHAQSAHQTPPIQIRILVDTAGGATVASRTLARRLRLRKTGDGEEYSGLNGISLTKGYPLDGEIQLIADDDSIVPVQAAVIDGEIPVGAVADIDELRRTNPQLNDVHIPPTGDGEPIDLLIGADTIIDILKPDKLTAINADSLLLPTKFGALIVGRQRRHLQKVCHSHQINFLSNPIQDLTNLDLVGLTGIAQSDIDEEEIAIQQFYQTVQFIDNRYSISWPWRYYPPPPQLDSNFGMALGRLRSLYRKLQKLPDLLQEYHAIILRQLDDGIIEKVNDSTSESQVTHYLPHHPVLQPEKSTSIRPVYDGSAKTTSKQKSLNDNIRKGTKWLTDLVSTLIRFRLHETVVLADIAKAFHQISINETDRDAARFLWLRDPLSPPTSSNIQIYRFTRVAFGIIASPFLLNAVIRHHASRAADNRFVQILLQDLYADNVVAALSDDIQPIEFYQYAKKFFGSMSMDLTKWATNSDELRKFIPVADQLVEVVQSVLGIKWNTIADVLTLKQPKILPSPQITPRIVAREIARYFDPLGWASPITLLAKLYFRAVWEETKHWDKQIPVTKTDEWNELLAKLQQTQNIRLPRRYFTLKNPKQHELHTFVDASAVAYAVVVYLRTENETESQTSIIASRSRLTPKKLVTIPKLELIAILLGCRFTEYVREALKISNIKSYIWSDSRCALAWMKQNKILPPVIEKYVVQAKKHKIDDMFYVPSGENFADVATRGTTFENLCVLRWWTGPVWLNDRKAWPHNDELTDLTAPSLNFVTQVTCKKSVLLENEIQGLATLSISDFSTLSALLRRTAFCFRALVQFRRDNFLHLQTYTDYAVALQWWIYWDQQRYYALADEPEAGMKFSLHNIFVFRDGDGIIRCKTRITNSAAELDTINPILLVKKSTLTRLIVLDVHAQHMHAGTTHTLANVRRTYWLPHGRREIYTIIHQYCLKCRRQFAEPYPQPPPAPLPEFRVTRTKKPFQAIGIDICGPFYTRATLGRNQPKLKRWVLLLTCAVVRAIHVEVLINMTTFEVLLAFRRFFARRGVPNKIISDNAPQFHVLDACFKNIWRDLADADAVSSYFAKHKISWEFVPQLSPWMGGLYERLVQSVKLALQKTYGDLILLDRQFETTMFEIENIINSRPISYVDREIDSPLLSPNDFLMAQFAGVPMDGTLQANEDILQKLWKSSQAYLDIFWKYWSDHYLLLLRERNDVLKSERRTASKCPEKGDLVVMVDLARKRASWQIAVVERLIHSKDTQVRAVQIKIPNGARLIRPISVLAPIHLTMDLPEVRDDQLNADRTAIIHSLPEDATHSQLEETMNEEETTQAEIESPQNRIQRMEETP